MSESKNNEAPPAADIKARVRVVREGTVIGDQVARCGQEHVVPIAIAERLVLAGRAVHAGARVRALQGLLFGNTWREGGAVFECSAAEALGWHNLGYVAVLEPIPSEIMGRLATPPPKRVPPPAIDPHAGEPRVKVRALKSFLAVNRVLGVGESAEVPASVADRAVEAGAAEHVNPIRKLADGAARALAV